MIWAERLRLEKLCNLTDKNEYQIVDHLFRHQYGKMVAILSKIFGLSNLELIEDAVQDTFLRAALKWRNELPENPEAWLTQAAKNRAVDLLRQINAEKGRREKVFHGAITLQINEYFLDHEVADSQLRMIFVACHPSFTNEEQIAFALKAISGFSMKEIAAALLQKEETIKKRLVRARKKIQDLNIALTYPAPNEIQERMSGVLQIIYLIFNEGFHSTKPGALISKDLCGEAIRLCKLLLIKENFRSGSLYALFALQCFHASRLESKLGSDGIIDLKQQDRSQWYIPLIILGNDALNKSMEYNDRSIYHIEAAIASEHVKAAKFDQTDWAQILKLYEEMYLLMPSDHILLSMASIYLQTNAFAEAKLALDRIDSDSMNQRRYLFHGCRAEYYEKTGDAINALQEIDLAIELCSNKHEQQYLRTKRKKIAGKDISNK
ncbi:MAG: sigma-70 family RNA polymerase sigma factor [Saprospiraceae bacterium]|nr:sigma-70 family RNA polymerase sigma factor [Saprospiraceae bacterium]